MPNEFSFGTLFMTVAMAFLVICVVLAMLTAAPRRDYTSIVALAVSLQGPFSAVVLTQRSM